MEVKIEMPNRNISRKLRKRREVVIDKLKYEVPHDIDTSEPIDYFDLILKKSIYELLIEAFEEVTVSSELRNQIIDVNVADIYNTEFQSDFALTLKEIVNEARYVCNKFFSSGYVQNEEYNSDDKEIKQEARKEASNIDKYIDKWKNIIKLLEQQGKYKELAILPIEYDDIKENYIIYPPHKQEKVIRLNEEDLKEEYEVINSIDLKPRKQIKVDNCIIIEETIHITLDKIEEMIKDEGIKVKVNVLKNSLPPEIAENTYNKVREKELQFSSDNGFYIEFKGTKVPVEPSLHYQEGKYKTILDSVHTKIRTFNQGYKQVK